MVLRIFTIFLILATIVSCKFDSSSSTSSNVFFPKDVQGYYIYDPGTDPKNFVFVMSALETDLMVCFLYEEEKIEDGHTVTTWENSTRKKTITNYDLNKNQTTISTIFYDKDQKKKYDDLPYTVTFQNNNGTKSAKVDVDIGEGNKKA